MNLFEIKNGRLRNYLLDNFFLMKNYAILCIIIMQN